MKPVGRKPPIGFRASMVQQEIHYPNSQYVALTRNERDTIKNAIDSLWECMDKIGELSYDLEHMAADHQGLYVQTHLAQCDLAHITAALMQAQRMGHYRGTASPSGSPE